MESLLLLLFPSHLQGSFSLPGKDQLPLSLSSLILVLCSLKLFVSLFSTHTSSDLHLVQEMLKLSTFTLLGN